MLRIALDNVDRATLYLTSAVWLLFVVGAYMGDVWLGVAEPVAIGYPLLLGGLALLGTTMIQREIRVVAVVTAAVAASLWIGLRLETQPLLAIAIPVLAGAAFFCGRRPAAAIIALLAFTATYSTIIAFTGLPTIIFIELLLAGLWVALLLRVLGSRQDIGGYQLWPGMIAMLGFLGITALYVVSAESMYLGMQSFRLSFFLMITFILIAYADWPEITYRRISKGLIAIGVLVAGYAIIQWQTGPFAAEEEFARLNPYNLVDGRLRTFGSFPTGHQLGFWAAMMAPFMYALTISMKGNAWRLLAGIAVLLCVAAAFASEARTVLVSAVVGILLVVVLISLARNLRGPKLATTAGVALAVFVVGTGAFMATAGTTDTIDRYKRIFDRDDDIAWTSREYKWDSALREMRERPLGHGLGTAGQIQQESPRYVNAASFNLDSSYLKVAYEQGWLSLIVLLVALVLLTVQLALMGIRAQDPEVAGRALGATGTLVAMLIAMYTGQYIEAPVAVFGWVILGLGMAGLVRHRHSEDSRAPAPSR